MGYTYRVRTLHPQGRKLRDTKKQKHLKTNWGDINRFPRLFALGCIDPEPFVEADPSCPGGLLYSIRCRETKLCFSVSEARGKDWIPTPDEVIERRNAVRESWPEDEWEQHEASRICSVYELRESRKCTTPVIDSSYAFRGARTRQSGESVDWNC